VRAARVHAYGPPENLIIEEVPDPVPGPGEVLVDVRAAAVNFPDVLIMADRYQVSVPVPFIPGSEYAGVVLEAGPDAASLRPGDRVFGSTMIGGFASRIVVPAAAVHRLPARVDLREAAGFWLTYATAYQSLRTVAGVADGDWVVVLGAAGGVGLAAVDVARLLGARVLAAASSDEKLQVCAQRGAAGLVNYDTEDLKLRIRQITGEGADVVIDPVGGPYAEQALRSTRWGGRFVCVGFASGEIPRIPLNLVLLKGVVIKGMDIRTIHQHAPEASRRAEEELMAHFAAGRLHPYVSETYPLERAAEALCRVRDRQAVGKVVIVP
jgi:NADPH2:quinone reductase